MFIRGFVACLLQDCGNRIESLAEVLPDGCITQVPSIRTCDVQSEVTGLGILRCGQSEIGLQDDCDDPCAMVAWYDGTSQNSVQAAPPAGLIRVFLQLVQRLLQRRFGKNRLYKSTMFFRRQ